MFVYGTLRPGDVRWRFLAPFVDDGWSDTVPDRVVVCTGRGVEAWADLAAVASTCHVSSPATGSPTAPAAPVTPVPGTV